MVFQQADAIFRGTVLSVRSYEEDPGGQISTRAILRVDEAFKGVLPSTLTLRERGGTIANRRELDGGAPCFGVGEVRLMLVSRRADGSAGATKGDASALKLSARSGVAGDPRFKAGEALLRELRSKTAGSPWPGGDLTDQAGSPEWAPTKFDPKDPPSASPLSNATNLLVGDDLVPARFIMPDRAEGIPYLIDADFLPAGMTLTQAVSAVQAALAAWTNVTTVRYRFAGLRSFGQAAPNVVTNDEVLRIQLHDHYNYLADAGGLDLLGKGGYTAVSANLSAGWTTGGNVSGNDFHRSVSAYVVLQHTNLAMQNLTTFTEVLAHEIGHTIGLVHSSQNQSEANPLLSQAIMFFVVHADGRGAALNGYDINSSRQVHPLLNTPPYAYDRVMDIVTASSPITAPGVNAIQVRGYDQQTTDLALQTNDATANSGVFSLTNSSINYAADTAFSDTTRLDPAGTLSYDRIYARYSDGTNASPYATIRVVSYSLDTSSPVEGIPDWWRAAYFGSVNVNAGINRHANDDFDGDGYSNLREWLLGSNPAAAGSNLRITAFSPTNLEWQAKPYEVYELYASTNLSNWSRALNPLTPATTPAATTGFTNGGPRQFFRVQKVP